MPSLAASLSRCYIDAATGPEKRLMLAVLEAAVADFQRYAAIPDDGGQSLFREAVTWFEYEDTTWPYSFVNVCQALGLEVTYVLAGLRRWRDAQRVRALRGNPVIRILLRRMVGIRSKATGYAPMGRMTPGGGRERPADAVGGFAGSAGLRRRRGARRA